MNAIHLGISSAGKKEYNINTTERISSARQTSYSLIYTSINGSNGLSPKVSYLIYRTYMMPRFLYGPEVVPLTKAKA